MYDIVICVLTSLSKKSRFDQFQEIGIKSSNKYKNKIVYLVEDDQKPNNLEDDWANIKGPMSCRFLSYLINENIEAKWVLQVDDDSCTDIDRTLEIIETFYDYKDPVLIMGSYAFLIHGKFHLSFNMDDCLQSAIKKLNVDNMFLGTSNINEFEMIPRFKHSWEQTMLSSTAVDKIKKSAKVRDFLNLCLEAKPEYSDQVPYVAAKLAKIPIDECFIFCPFPIASEYTAINKNGRYTHIHHVLNLWDELENFKNLLSNNIKFDNKIDTKNALRNINLENTFWFMDNGSIIRFEKFGRTDLDELTWKQNENELLLFESNKKTTALKRTGAESFEGLNLKTGQKVNLKKIDVISLIGMSEIKNKYG